jgi:4-amino-4-deoxy-L-arabinose transferase-like glycosyltransferase
MLPFQAHRSLYFLLIISFLVRLLAATALELGNDEAYYWTYAAFPDWSHFDHPPMVGYLIQFFTVNLQLNHEVFMRLGPLLLGTLSTYLMYAIVLEMANKSAAFISALLFSGSIYAMVISGVFIMPDAPLLPLWLFSLYLLLPVLSAGEITPTQGRKMMAAGLAVGLAVLSKYHAVFLWLGCLTYIFLFNRQWLRRKELYVAILLTLICGLPLLVWNVQNEFVSFRFQGERVLFFGNSFRIDRLATELLGQFFYNNPLNVLLTFIVLRTAFKTPLATIRPQQRMLLLSSLPLIALILFFACFRKTLPHWSGPAYVTLIPLVACYLDRTKNKIHRRMVSTSAPLCFFILIVGVIEVNMGIFTSAAKQENIALHKTGKNDLTLDLFGWRQVAEQFQTLREKNNKSKCIAIVSNRWFNAAHLDYYVAQPNQLPLYAFGELKSIHKYAWINLQRGELPLNSNAWYLTPSRSFRDPERFLPYFHSITPIDTFPIYRLGKPVEYFFVYQLNKYNGNFINPVPVHHTNNPK